jgi:hypothetical protein
MKILHTYNVPDNWKAVGERARRPPLTLFSSLQANIDSSSEVLRISS